MIGQIISHYKILEKLGEGGMGVVYKAEDTKLKRFVALKFLPREKEVHEAERARFVQEAQSASALNHPNVCVIHDIAEYSGQQFIVMEFVEGRTLREILPIQKIDDAITYAIQIGEALNAAHSKGIAHRDIKADNIMLNSNNQIKVMDFGLAKLKGSLKLTRTSGTVGTLAYMAPEQIEGGEVDARSDIFSFGVVLFQMLTGHLPFRGEHEAAMMYSILNEEPEPLTKHLPGVPAELTHVFNRAVEKDPADRYQSIADVIIDLRRLKRYTSKVVRPLPAVPSTGEPVPSEAHVSKTAIEVAAGVPATSPPSAPMKKVFWKRPLVLAGTLSILLIVAVIIFLVMQRGTRGASGTMVTRVLKLPSPTANFPNISADGNWVAFVAQDEKQIQNLYIVHVSGGEPKKLTNDTMYVDLQSPCFSPDASQIIYERVEYSPKFDRALCTVSALGGTPRKLIRGGMLPIWSPDGKHIAFFRYAMGRPGLELLVANSDGTGERKLVGLVGKDYVTTPAYFFNEAWSPDSKRLAFLRSFLTPTKERYTEIFIRGLEDSTERQITFDKKIIDDFCWTSTGEIVFNSTRGGNVNLWVIPEDGGTPKQLTLGAGADRLPRISRDAKHLVYVNESETSNLWKFELSTGQVQQLTFEDAQLYGPAFSSDGAKIIYRQFDSFDNSRSGFYICNKDGSESSKLPTNIENYTPNMALWPAAGKPILLNAFRTDTVRKNPDSLVTRSAIFEYDPGTNAVIKIGDGSLYDASRDGKYVIYRRNEEPNYWNMVLAPRATPDKPIKEVVSRWSRPSFSWDSKSVITSDSAGITFVSVEESKGKKFIKRPKNFGLVYQMPDGKSLLGSLYDPALKKYDLVKVQLSDGKIEKIAPLPPSSQIWGRSSSLSPDGRTLVFSRSESKNRILVLDNFR